MKQKKKTGCLTWIGYVFIAILIMYGVGSLGSGNDDGEQGNVEVSVDSNENSTEKESEPEKKETNVTFETGKIYSGHKCKFKLSKGDEKGFSVEIDNNSKKDYSFDIHSMAINGVMTNCNIYTAGVDVPSKKKGIMEVEFEPEWLDGIDNVEYVDFVIWVYDNAKSYKDFETDIIRIKTNKFTKEKKYKGNKDSKKLNGIIVQKERLDTDEFVFSVINKNKEFVEFDFINSSINGWALDSDYSFDAKEVCVYPNSISTVKIDLSDFSEHNNIKKVKNIEFSLGVRQKGDYFKEIETKKIKFK